MVWIATETMHTQNERHLNFHNLFSGKSRNFANHFAWWRPIKISSFVFTRFNHIINRSVLVWCIHTISQNRERNVCNVVDYTCICNCLRHQRFVYSIWAHIITLQCKCDGSVFVLSLSLYTHTVCVWTCQNIMCVCVVLWLLLLNFLNIFFAVFRKHSI